MAEAVDPWAGWTNEGPAAPQPQHPQDAAPKPVDPWAGWTNEGPNSPPRLDISRSKAFIKGALDTMSFGTRDEIRGLSVASGLPEWMGGYRAPVGAGRLLYEKWKRARGENQGGLSGAITGDQRGPIEKVFDKETEATRNMQAQA